MNNTNFIISLFSMIFDKINRFKLSHKYLHEIFYYFKTYNNDYNFLLNDFLFRNNNIYPICDLLDKILDELQLCGYINIDNKVIKICFKNNDILKNFRSNLNSEEKKNFNKMSEEFLEFIKKEK